MAKIEFDPRHLFLSLLTAIVVYVIVAFLLELIGLSDFDAKTALVSVPTIFGVVFLIIFGLVSSGEISWSKQGFDFSVLAFGAVLSALTLQLFLKTPVLPRLAHGSAGIWIDKNLGPGHAMYVLLIFGAFLSLILCFLTGLVELHLKGAREAKKIERREKAYAFFNYVAGICSLSLYTAIVCGGVDI
jgi:hypothetical protein